VLKQDKSTRMLFEHFVDSGIVSLSIETQH